MYNIISTLVSLLFRFHGASWQVLATTTESDFMYTKLTSITDRVVFVKAKVNFGRLIGQDDVLIVIPIPIYNSDSDTRTE